MTARGTTSAGADLVDAVVPADSILDLARELVRIPSRGGEDSPEPIITMMCKWLERRDVPTMLLPAQHAPTAVLVTLDGGRPGPTYCLNACLDTAPFGDLRGWHHPPTAARVHDSRLYGRGAADSKVAVAIFAHVAAALVTRADALRGRLLVLFDCDEHTGEFGGAKALLKRHPEIAGAMIGYPGPDEIVIGARGFYRATITLYGNGGHSGARSTSTNAIEKAVGLVDALRAVDLSNGATAAFPIAPSLSVTGIRGGGSFSMIPDLCEIMIDARLTPMFTSADARALLDGIIADVDRREPGSAPAEWNEPDSWPAYRLADDSPVARALLGATRALRDPAPRPHVCGPSNIGNLFAAHGIDATCGFGVGYENLHAPNESATVSDIPMVYRGYREAIEVLLAADGG